METDALLLSDESLILEWIHKMASLPDDDARAALRLVPAGTFGALLRYLSPGASHTPDADAGPASDKPSPSSRNGSGGDPPPPSSPRSPPPSSSSPTSRPSATKGSRPTRVATVRAGSAPSGPRRDEEIAVAAALANAAALTRATAAAPSASEMPASTAERSNAKAALLAVARAASIRSKNVSAIPRAPESRVTPAEHRGTKRRSPPTRQADAARSKSARLGTASGRGTRSVAPAAASTSTSTPASSRSPPRIANAPRKQTLVAHFKKHKDVSHLLRGARVLLEDLKKHLCHDAIDDDANGADADAAADPKGKQKADRPPRRRKPLPDGDDDDTDEYDGPVRRETDREGEASTLVAFEEVPLSHIHDPDVLVARAKADSKRCSGHARRTVRAYFAFARTLAASHRVVVDESHASWSAWVCRHLDITPSYADQLRQMYNLLSPFPRFQFLAVPISLLVENRVAIAFALGRADDDWQREARFWKEPRGRGPARLYDPHVAVRGVPQELQDAVDVGVRISS